MLASSTTVCKPSLWPRLDGASSQVRPKSGFPFLTPCATSFTTLQVLDLRKRVEGLRSSDTPGETPATEDAAAPQPTTDGTPPEEDSSAPPPSSSSSARGEAEKEGGEENGGVYSDRRSCLRTRSSPTLSPTSEAAAAAAASARFPRATGAQQSGQYRPVLHGAPGRGGDVTPPGGVRGGNRRSTIGPGSISADESFGYALESLAARDGGGGLQAGVLGWWRRSEWREGNEGPMKSQPLHPPAAPAVVEDQERLGSLYSMIARR